MKTDMGLRSHKVNFLSICNHYIFLLSAGDKWRKGFNLGRRFVTIENLGEFSDIFSNFQGKQHEQ